MNTFTKWHCTKCRDWYDSLPADKAPCPRCGTVHKATNTAINTATPPKPDIISERAKTHGDYAQMCATYEGMRRAFWNSGIRKVLNDGQAFAIDMIFVKLARMASGDPNFPDHVDDLIGYSRLYKSSTEVKP